MKWSQLGTFLWLRWRLSLNQSKRLSKANVFIGRLLKVLLALFACASFGGLFLVGRSALVDAPPVVLILVWDAALVGFVFFSLMGLLTEVQRAEMLSLDRMLHLPVSPAGAFLINYLGSSVNLTLLLFLPGMLGLALGSVVSRGAAMAPLFLLTACFFLMITAVVYQVRGWLASMMANRRRRQTILAIVTSLFLCVVLAPSLLANWNGSDSAEQSAPDAAGPAAESDELEQAVRMDRLESRVRLINAVVPPGWLAHGAAKLLERDWLLALAAAVGMGLIGALSLMRSYRTTLRLYTGDFAAGGGKSKAAARRSDRPGARVSTARLALTERSLPLISEHASAIAVTTFRALLRSPEAKLTLLSPLLMTIVFGGMFASSDAEVPEYGRAVWALGLAVAIMLMTMIHFIGNQFAYDRDAFRSFMLSSASRRDVLLGKNLSFFPISFAFMLLAILGYHWFFPLRIDHFAAVLMQTISVYFVYCLLGNVLSIYAPVAVRPTNGMPLPGQGAKMILQMLMIIVFAIPLSVVFIPLGIEYALHVLNPQRTFPAFLVFSVVQVGVTLWLYRTLLGSQGLLLQRREQMILAVVTQRTD